MKLNLEGAGPNSRSTINRDIKSLSPSYSREYPLVVDKALGSEIWDVDGRRFIDFMAGVAVMNVGHRHPHVQQKISDQLDRFWHICLADFYYPQAVELAEMLQGIAPMPDTRIYLANSGTEAVEAAIKLAMKYTGRDKFIGFLGSFHGRTLGSLSFTASKAIQSAGYPSAVPVFHVPFPDPYRPYRTHINDDDSGAAVAEFMVEELFRTVVSPHDVAAILAEPIQGEGGYVIPAEGFFTRLREICDQFGILLIVDEIQSGVGRTGRWWAIEHESVQPDIVCFAKGIASGLPIGGIIARDEIMTWEPGSHGSTFGGNPIAAAAAIGTLEVIQEEDVLAQGAASGKAILEIMREMQRKHPFIGDVRGRGLMIGIEFVKDRDTKERFPELREAIIEEAFLSGLLLLPCGPNSVRITPPLNISATLLEEGMSILDDVLDKVDVDHGRRS
jgi:4-aminobutyrate aminotransferase